MGITSYSTSASSNTAISGIAIGEGMARADVNNAIRQLIADIAAYKNAITETKNIGDHGGVEGLVADNTAAFEAAVAALGSNGGIVKFPVGNWRGNFVVNQHNIIIEGAGGVGEINQTCLRPYATGAGTTTLKISDQTRLNRKCGLHNLVVSGDNGSGTMAANALWVNGGTVNFWANQVDLMDGTVTLRIEPGGTYPATALKFHQVTIRNDVNSASARAIYVRKYSDATGYVTDLQFAQLKVNKTANGYWLEVDGTGSTGLVVHFSQTYVDHGAAMGILTSTAGLEVIECDGGLQLDPGAAASVIMLRRDNVKDPTRYFRGHIEGVGGQKIEFLDTTQLTLPSEPGYITYQPKFESGFFGGIGYYQPDPAAPYSTTVYFDFQSGTGPMRWYGVRHKWMDTTEAADPAGTIDGATTTLGGLATAKKVWAGGACHSNVGFFLATTQVVGARQATVTAPTGGATVDAESRTAINALIARLQAHGLIS